MKVKTYKTITRFGIFVSAYDLQGDEEIVMSVILFGRGLQIKFQPKQRVVSHFEFRLPPIATIDYGRGDVRRYKTKVLEWENKE